MWTRRSDYSYFRPCEYHVRARVACEVSVLVRLAFSLDPARCDDRVDEGPVGLAAGQPRPGTLG